MASGIVGWDIGGAHVKAVVTNRQGLVVQLFHQPCPLWQGLPELESAVSLITKRICLDDRCHAVTMTGELVDLFDNRWQGVQQIIRTMVQCVQEEALSIYAGGDKFYLPDEISQAESPAIASANWLATLNYVTGRVRYGLLVDIGSTTTDIVLIDEQAVRKAGTTDFQRLCSNELIYTGIVRTPVMSITDRVKFMGLEINLMAEHFATMADVYRLTGELNEAYDQMATADGGEKSPSGSRCRLARMIGCDVDDFTPDQWLQLAETLRSQQLQKIYTGCSQQLDRKACPESRTVIGAGSGRFLVKEIATQLGLEYRDFSELFPSSLKTEDLAIADCAPAAAVACLYAGFYK